MPVPTNNSRPSLPYDPKQSLPNNQRFGLLEKRPPTAEMLDAEFNSLQDDINDLANAINQVQAGNIPGSDNLDNANKTMITDGQGNLSFVLVDTAQIAENAVTSDEIAPQAVKTPKLGDGAVTNPKIAPNAIATNQIQDGSVITPKIADGAISANKIADGAITTVKVGDGVIATNKIADKAVTAAKIADNAINSAKILNQSILLNKLSPLGANNTAVPTFKDGNVNWEIPPINGKILQIVCNTFTDRNVSTQENPRIFRFNPRFSVTITPKFYTSTILLFVMMQAAPLMVPGWVTTRLYRRGALFIPKDLSKPYSAMFSKYIEQTDTSKIGTTCFSGFFQDAELKTDLTPIEYEVITLGSVILNGDQNNVNEPSNSSMTTISSLIAVEIQL